MSDTKFRAIVIGGGPAGLMAAHIFNKAGLDFIVLERGQSLYPDLGASLALWPHTLRTLDQVDLIESFRPLMSELSSKTTMTHDGTVFGNSNVFERVEKLHGYRTSMFHRRDLLKAFYDNLPENAKPKVFTNKKVVSIETTETGVTVRCDDGTTEHGTIVIGADGAHSKTRQLMRDLALARSPETAVNAEHPYLTTYRVMFGNAPVHEKLHKGEVYESHGQDVSSQLFVGKERMWFFIYERLEKPTKVRTSYTEGDMVKYAEKLGHINIAKDISLKEVFSHRNNAGLTDLEEGVADYWSWDRIVLVGDAAHKVTPNMGWGFNSGVQDLVSLSNRLNKLINGNTEAPTQPTTSDFTALFKEYQDERMEFMTKISEISARVTRQSAWYSWVLYFLDRYVFNYFNVDALMSQYVMGPLISRIPVLEFLKESHFVQGQIPWVHKPSV